MNMNRHQHEEGNKNAQSMKHAMHGSHQQMLGNDHQDQHAMMVVDFQRRFWISLITRKTFTKHLQLTL